LRLSTAPPPAPLRRKASGAVMTGTTIFLVDQNARAALAVADRAYVLETGRVVLARSGAELLEDEQVKEAYLGL